MQERRKTAVGRIAKSFGLSGELMVSLFDTFPADFDTKEPLFVVIDKLAVPLFCDRFERRGRRSALVVFSDFYSEKRTDELIGCELFLEGEEDVPDGMAKLRTIYPNLMRLEYDNKRTRSCADIGISERVEEKSELELFRELYELQNNQDMTAQQEALVEELIRGLKA